MLDPTLQELVDQITDLAITRIEDMVGIDPDEIHHEIYNTDYFVVGRHEAKTAMCEFAFDCIGAVQEYEQFHFGEVTTDLSEPEKVLNMLAYIIGEDFLGEVGIIENYESVTDENKAEIENHMRDVAKNFKPDCF